MNKNVYLFFVVVILLLVSVGLLFYPAERSGTKIGANISFRDVEFGYSEPHQKRVYEDMTADISVFQEKKRIRMLKNQQSDVSKPLSATGVVSYVNSDLSFFNETTIPKKLLSNNSNYVFRKYNLESTLALVQPKLGDYQRLNIHKGVEHLHGESSRVEVGTVMGVECSHEFEDINWSEDGLFASCGNCNSRGEVLGFNDDGTLKIEWTPIGDVVLPILLMAVCYVLLMLCCKR